MKTPDPDRDDERATPDDTERGDEDEEGSDPSKAVRDYTDKMVRSGEYVDKGR